MTRETQEYLLSLDAGRVNRHQHHLLMVIGCYRQSARETFWPSQKTLAIKCHIGEGLGTESDQRQVRRMVQELTAAGILAFDPGNGRGNRGAYRFPELETRTKAAQTRTGESAFSEINPDTNPDNPQPVRGIEVDLTRPLQDPSVNSSEKPNCAKHPDSGLTNWGSCWDCYAEKYSGPRKEPRSVSA